MDNAIPRTFEDTQKTWKEEFKTEITEVVRVQVNFKKKKNANVQIHKKKKKKKMPNLKFKKKKKKKKVSTNQSSPNRYSIFGSSL